MTWRLGVLALGVVAISCAAVLVRLAEAPPLAIATVRLLIASAVLLPVGLFTTRGEMLRLFRGEWRLLLLSGTFLALHFALWVASLSYTTVVSSVVLVTATPLIVALVSRALFDERLRSATFVGIALSLIGALLIGYAGITRSGQAMYGDLLALLAAVAMAGYLLVGWRVRGHAGLIAYSSSVFAVAALVLCAAAAVSGTRLTGYTTATYDAMLALALVPQLVGHMSLNWALRFLPATMVTVAVLGEPVGATFLAWAVLSEAPTLMEAAGAALLLSGIAFAFRKGGRAPSLPHTARRVRVG